MKRNKEIVRFFNNYERNILIKFNLQQAMKTQMEARHIAPVFLQPRRYVRVCDQLHSPAALPPGKRPATHSAGGCLVHRACLDGCRKRHLHRDSIPGLSCRGESLYRLSYQHLNTLLIL